MATARGDFDDYFYGYWLLPFFKLFSLLTFETGYILWISLSILGVWFSARVFNGKGTLALLSYQMSCVLFWGQNTGIICGMLGLFWWATHHRKWNLAGFAFLIAIAKPQSGRIFALLLLIFLETSWQEKIRILILPSICILLTFIIYPNWVVNVIARRGAVLTMGNITLWQWIGPWGLLIFIPLILFKARQEQRFFLLITAFILASPYSLQTELLVLFVFPVGIIPILLGYLPGIMVQIYSFEGQKAGFIAPQYIL